MKDKELELYIKTNYPVQTGLDNPILRRKSEPVNEINEDI